MTSLKNKYKYWSTKDKRKIAVKHMTTRHIINTINMLERNGYIAFSTFIFYMTDCGPDGDMAQLAFDEEFENVIYRKPTKWIDIFNNELKIRGVIK